MPRLHLVYSADNDYSDLTSPIVVGVVFILFLSAVIAYFLKKQTIITRLFEMVAGEEAWNLALVGCLFTGVIFWMIATTDVSSFIRSREVYNSDQMLFVEGRVTDYSPMPPAGHADEYFTVKDVGFNFSDYEEGIGGYHNAASHGGVIRPNLYVKIGYYHTDFRNIILKLETE